MSQKLLITIFFILFAVSSIFLFWQSERELNPDRNKSWWTLSFVMPKDSQSFDFVVENWSDHTEFSYEIVRGKKTVTRDSFRLNRGEKKTIFPLLIVDANIRTSIIVTAEEERKEIYR